MILFVSAVLFRGDAGTSRPTLVLADPPLSCRRYVPVAVWIVLNLVFLDPILEEFLMIGLFGASVIFAVSKRRTSEGSLVCNTKIVLPFVAWDVDIRRLNRSAMLNGDGCTDAMGAEDD